MSRRFDIHNIGAIACLQESSSLEFDVGCMHGGGKDEITPVEPPVHVAS